MKHSGLIFIALLMSTPGFAITIDTDEPRTIVADRIEYDFRSETLKTSGNTEIVNESGQRMTLTDSYITQSGAELSGSDIKMWLGNHVYVSSDNITRRGDLTVARNATFTACDDCDAYGDAWEITTYKIIHDMERRMLEFYSPVLRTYDLPIFWLPYFEMPDPGVRYKTGLLMPDFESTNKMGTQINVPFYISISDTHDMTVTLSYLTQENPLFQLEHRLNADYSEYRTSGSFTHNKAGENRWHIFNDDIIELGDNARATIFLERTSDKTYLQKYGFYGDQPYLDSGAKLELFGQSSYVVADTHIFQELRNGDYASNRYSAPDGNILPNIRAVHQTAPLFGETYATFGADMLGISGDGTSSQRLIGDARLTTPWTLWGGNRITASVSTRYDLYHFDNTLLLGNDIYSGFKHRFLPSGYLEWGLPMFRASDEWTQTLEPRARITVMRHLDKEAFALSNDSAGTILTDSTLFSDNRFSGLDLWENGTYADYGVRWSAFNPTGHMVEVFVGQSYDFTDRPAIDLNSGFHNGLSDYVGRIAYTYPELVGLSTRFRLNQDTLALNHMETSANIGSSRNFLNVGHIWSRNLSEDWTENTDINEAVIGAGLQLTDRWSMRWNAIYNIEVHEFQRHTGGFFYTHPCYYLSVEYRRDNAIKEDYVGTTTFQFRFGMAINGQQY